MKFWLASLLASLTLASSAQAQTLDQLIAGAKNEGKLVIYASAAAQHDVRDFWFGAAHSLGRASVDRVCLHSFKARRRAS